MAAAAAGPVASTSTSAMSSARLYAELSSTCWGGSRVSPSSVRMGGHARRRSLNVVCQSESAGGCCGGSSGSGGGSASGSSCSSHGKSSLANLGKEFEHLVAANTLLEFEKDYISAPMEGKITREIMDTVMDTNPDDSTSEGEKLIDINELLREAESMSNGELIFSEDPDFVFV